MANAASSTTSNNSICAICQDEILPTTSTFKLNCNHQYHQACLQPWLDGSHNTCPLDRNTITSINGVAIKPSEEKESNAHIHVIEEENLLIEARALYQRNIVGNPLIARPLYQRNIVVIQNPSIYSDDPVERQAAKVKSIFFSTFYRTN